MANGWYVATLIIRCRVQNNEIGPWTCDEQIRVLRAPDSGVAYEKALQLGRSEEESYQNADGETVFWEFVGLADLEALFDSTIKDGTEIKSHLFKSDNPVKQVHEREELTVFRWELERQRRAQTTSRDLNAGYAGRSKRGVPRSGKRQSSTES